MKIIIIKIIKHNKVGRRHTFNKNYVTDTLVLGTIIVNRPAVPWVIETLPSTLQERVWSPEHMAGSGTLIKHPPGAHPG